MKIFIHLCLHCVFYLDEYRGGQLMNMKRAICRGQHEGLRNNLPQYICDLLTIWRSLLRPISRITVLFPIYTCAIYLIFKRLYVLMVKFL